MTTETVNWKKTFLLAGSLCAAFMGAGFISGQEVLQFFTSLGSMALVAIAISLVLFIYFAYMIFGTSREQNFGDPYDIFEYYCGKIIGQFMVWFTVALMYGVFLIMLSGSGATINQYFGFSTTGTVWVMGIATLLTVWLGVEKLISIVGVIGPIKVLFVVVVGIATLSTLFASPTLLSEADRIIPTLDLKRASSNWVISGILYACLYVISAVPFMVALGASATSKKEAIVSGIAGMAAFVFSVFMLVTAELINIQAIYGKQVPTLVVAENISPILGTAFAIIIVISTYSTASSYLWTIARKFAEDRSKKFFIVTVVLTSIGIFFGGVVPFDVLVNTLYPISGYVGILFLICIIYKHIKDRYGKGSVGDNVEAEPSR